MMDAINDNNKLKLLGIVLTFACTLGISLLSSVCILIVYYVKTQGWFRYAFIFTMSFAISVLLSSVVLHLMPEMYGVHDHAEEATKAHTVLKSLAKYGLVSENYVQRHLKHLKEKYDMETQFKVPFTLYSKNSLLTTYAKIFSEELNNADFNNLNQSNHDHSQHDYSQHNLLTHNYKTSMHRRNLTSYTTTDHRVHDHSDHHGHNYSDHHGHDHSNYHKHDHSKPHGHDHSDHHEHNHRDYHGNNHSKSHGHNQSDQNGHDHTDHHGHNHTDHHDHNHEHGWADIVWNVGIALAIIFLSSFIVLFSMDVWVDEANSRFKGKNNSNGHGNCHGHIGSRRNSRPQSNIECAREHAAAHVSPVGIPLECIEHIMSEHDKNKISKESYDKIELEPEQNMMVSEEKNDVNKNDEVKFLNKRSRFQQFKSFLKNLWFKIHFNTPVLVVTIGDLIHNFVDGLAIGLTFSTAKTKQGLLNGVKISGIILAHELPHEVGDYAIYMSNGLNAKEALFLQLASSLTCILGGFIGYYINPTKSSQYTAAVLSPLFLYLALYHLFPHLKQLFHGSKNHIVAYLVMVFGQIVGFVCVYLIEIATHMAM